MAKLKYAEGVSKLLNEHSGYTFQPNHYGQSTFPASKSGRFRRPSQNKQQQNLMKAVTFWRDMDYTTKNNWNTFAATYPQASRRNPALFLSGYQLFLKRCHYCFLNNGITSDFMTEPTLEELEKPEFTIEIKQSDNSLDCSANYLKYFGRFPKAGDYVLCKIYPMAEHSGQFFEPIELTLSVDEIYFDGLFLSFLFPRSVPNIVFSVYLSKVVYQSVNYIGTKIRYMGCFTPKTFKALTDVPDVTAADDGKVWGVGPDGTWQLVEAGGGGGLTCEDLAECPTIVNINNMLSNIAEVVSVEVNSAIPPVNFGLLYNLYAYRDNILTSSDDFRMPDYAELISLVSYLGGSSVAGGLLKEMGLDYFNSPNTGATNSKSFNLRATGYRTSSGSFSYLKSRADISVFNTSSTNVFYTYHCEYNTTSLTGAQVINRNYGMPIRFVKEAPGIADGVKGIYIGNNGRIYRTISLNSLIWMADYLCETKFRDGSVIQEITDAAEWNALTTGAMCAYANDWDNV